MPEPDLLERAIRTLAGVCDGAQADDGRGYNQIDAAFGHSLASTPASTWTPRQRRAAWKMVRKYRGQLANADLDYDAIPEPTTPGPSVSVDVGPAKDIRLEDNRYVVTFPYDATLVSAIKALPGRWRFAREPVKHWHATRTDAVTGGLRAFAMRWDFALALEVERAFEELDDRRIEAADASRAADADLVIPGLRGEPRPFQRAGVAYVLARDGRAIIGDDQGLGKTIEALMTILALEAFPALVVCPSIAKSVWLRHAISWLPPERQSVTIVAGTPSRQVEALCQQFDVVILNYDILARYEAPLIAAKFQAVIFDECHRIKNHRAKRTKAAERVARRRRVVLPLSGTVYVNRPQELVTALKVTRRLEDVGGFWGYLDACGLRRGQYGLEPIEESKSERLARLARVNSLLRSTCYLRRLKRDVLSELPPKRRAIIPLEQGEKLVAFAHHVELQHALAAAFPGCARIKAGQSDIERADAERRFQEDEDCRLIVCSLQAGRESVTLTAASNVAFLELGWTPMEHDQAEDRCHRIGQHDSVTAWYLLAEDTIDIPKAEAIDRKRAEGTALMDGEVPTASEEASGNLALELSRLLTARTERAT